jgi:hypothetical protein
MGRMCDITRRALRLTSTEVTGPLLEPDFTNTLLAR